MRLRFLTLFALGTLLTLLPAVNAAPTAQITTLPDGSVKLTADDGAAGDGFGQTAFDGYTAVIGAPYDDDNGDNSGSAYIFVRDNQGNWTQQAKLTADDGAEADLFGWYVDVHGDTALVSAFADDTDAGNNAGSAYVFVRDTFGNWTQQAKLTASNAGAGHFFSRSVALDGDTALIGAYGYDGQSGSAYVFTRDGDAN